MLETKTPIQQYLERRGITDPGEYLNSFDENAEVVSSGNPFVWLRGSIYLMLGRVVSRKTVDAEFAKLRRI